MPAGTTAANGSGGGSEGQPEGVLGPSEETAPETPAAGASDALAGPASGPPSEDVPQALPKALPGEDALPSAPRPAPLSGGAGKSPNDPMEVPTEGMVITGGVYYGVSLKWFKTVSFGADDTLYFSITVPSGVTAIAANGFLDSYSSEKTKQGAVTYNDKAGRYNVVAVDFSGTAAGPLPQTGDAGAPLLWLALLAASGAGLLAVFALKRRDRG